jgi:hypothetical protein
LVTLLFLGLLQVGIDFYVRNVLVACLADGARYGANSDIASSKAGAAKANAEITRSLGSSYATAVASDTEQTADGAPIVTVQARARLPLLAWFLPIGPVIHARGEALMEPP